MTHPVLLSERDRQALDFVRRVRVASARHIERAYFPPAEGTALTAARRCRRCLARLVEADLLHRLNRQVGGVRAGSSGFLYTITSRGLRVLGVSHRARRYEPSERYVAHVLAGVDLHADLVAEQRKGRLVRLAVTHEPATWRRFQSVAGVEMLKPDLLVECDTAEGWELRTFVEIDRATEHLPAVIRKCQAYRRYWQSGAESRRHPIFPRVLWTVPDEHRAEAIRAAVGRSTDLTAGLFSVAISDEAVAAVIRPPRGSH